MVQISYRLVKATAWNLTWLLLLLSSRCVDNVRGDISDFDLRAYAQQVLRPGEKLLWAARPDRRQFTRLQWPLVFFGLFWSAITLTVSVGFVIAMFFTPSPKQDFPLILKPLILLFFVPFWAVGFYMLGGHTLVARKQWGRTLYALTSQNIIIRTGRTEVRLDHDAVKNVEIERLKGGLGTVRFLGSPATDPLNVSFGKVKVRTDSASQAPAFQAIADPDGFVELARRVLLAKNPPQPGHPQAGN